MNRSGRDALAGDPLHFLVPQPVGAPVTGQPWIAHVNTADLDGDGRLDILACEAKEGAVLWLRQSAAREFQETRVAEGLPAPVHVEAADMDGDGDLDLLVACMGQVMPSNDKIGSVVILENMGGGTFARHDIADHIARVTDVRAADFDGDGLPDLAVAQFGYDEGEIRWMRNRGGWRFDSEVLLSLSGAINVVVNDFNGDGRPDFAALISQEWEQVYLFENQGGGRFTHKVLWESSNEDFGSSGLSMCDVNRDGRMDLLYTNGDGFDYATPGPRPWHGVQWLENKGRGDFAYHRLGGTPGAYSPTGIDIDGDGAVDIFAVSGFNYWDRPHAASITLWHNDGAMNFRPIVLAYSPTHLMTATSALLDGHTPALITGGFHAYPPFDKMSRITVWWPRGR